MGQREESKVRENNGVGGRSKGGRKEDGMVQREGGRWKG